MLATALLLRASPPRMSQQPELLLRASPPRMSQQSQLMAERLAVLPRLGDAQSLLIGEKKAEQRRKQVLRKPDARVRLFAMYGVADSANSMRKWASAAPDWLEVRILELPGHGYRADEELPPCAARLQEPVENSVLDQQRKELIEGLASEVQAVQQRDDDASPCCCAFLGFSFGALLAYELVRELQRRDPASPPLALFALGRGAPHAVTLSNQRIAELQEYDDEVSMRGR